MNVSALSIFYMCQSQLTVWNRKLITSKTGNLNDEFRIRKTKVRNLIAMQIDPGTPVVMVMG